MTPLTDGSLLVAGGCVVDGCGSASAETFVMTGDMVARGPALTQARDAHTATALLDGRVLVVGGFGAEGTPPPAGAEVFDPATGAFRPGPALRAGRYKLGGSVAALPDGRVVVAGGGSGVEVLDLAAGSRRVDAARLGRASFSTVGVSGSRVVVVGGYDERIQLTRTFETFSVSTR